MEEKLMSATHLALSLTIRVLVVPIAPFICSNHSPVKRPMTGILTDNERLSIGVSHLMFFGKSLSGVM